MSRGVSVKTPERVARARELREVGMAYDEIAALLGVARGATVGEWVRDPDGSRLRARKDSYGQPCVDCGAPTSGSEGRREEPRCLRCTAVRSGAERKIWTPEAIILAIQEWAAKYGEPPAAPDWNPWHCRHVFGDEERALRAEREQQAGRCPSYHAPIREFGTWNAAIRAAGFDPRPGHGGAGNELRRRSMRAAAA